jgi:hypothetical protein
MKMLRNILKMIRRIRTMIMSIFNATCPYEIGDTVDVLEAIEAVPGVKTYQTAKAIITDIACTHYVASGKVAFSFELNRSGKYVPLVDKAHITSVINK